MSRVEDVRAWLRDRGAESIPHAGGPHHRLASRSRQRRPSGSYANR